MEHFMRNEDNFSSRKHVSEQSYYLVSCSFSKLHMLLTKKGHQFLAIQNCRNLFSMNSSYSIKCPATNALQMSYLFPCYISHSNFKPGQYSHTQRWEKKSFPIQYCRGQYRKGAPQNVSFSVTSGSLNNFTISYLLSTSSGRLASEISFSEPCNKQYERSRMEEVKYLSCAVVSTSQ